MMLGNLSYINLIALVCYFLAYLQNGSVLVVAGVLGVIIFNGLVLGILEGRKVSFAVFLFCLIIALCFAGWVAYGAFFQLWNLIEYQYYTFDVLRLGATGLLLAISLMIHAIWAGRDYLTKKDE